MTLEKATEILVTLTEKQVALFRVISTMGVAPASALSERCGGAVTALRERGLITRMGKINRKQKWALSPSWEFVYKNYKQDIDLLLNKILGTSI